MKTQMATLTLAVLGGLGAMAMPSVSHAGNVGYYGDNCYNVNPSSIITAAGHTPVAVASLDAASLTGLQGLFINGCSFATNAAVDSAVNSGMVLIWHDPNWGNQASKSLPGGQTIPYTKDGGNNSQIDFPSGSPVTAGPGGTINNASLDNGSSSNHGYVDAGSLPAGSQILATQDNASYVTTFAYNTGSGKVVFSTIPVTCYFPAGPCIGNVAVPGMQAYATNLIAWAVSGGVVTTCASSGYTGTQLQWCVKICESGLSGKALDDWIHRWIRQFRQLPYCAVGGGNPPPPPPPPPGE